MLFWCFAAVKIKVAFFSRRLPCTSLRSWQNPSPVRRPSGLTQRLNWTFFACSGGKVYVTWFVKLDPTWHFLLVTAIYQVNFVYQFDLHTCKLCVPIWFTKCESVTGKIQNVNQLPDFLEFVFLLTAFFACKFFQLSPRKFCTLFLPHTFTLYNRFLCISM